MKLKKLLALALAGVMALALFTGCSDSKPKAEQVEEYFRYMMGRFYDYQKDEVLDKKLEVIAQEFQPDWITTSEYDTPALTSEAEKIIRQQFAGSMTNGEVQFCWTEIRPDQNALVQAESMNGRYIEFGTGGYYHANKRTLAFTTTTQKKDGHRYYLALAMYWVN